MEASEAVGSLPVGVTQQKVLWSSIREAPAFLLFQLSSPALLFEPLQKPDRVGADLLQVHLRLLSFCSCRRSARNQTRL